MCVFQRIDSEMMMDLKKKDIEQNNCQLLNVEIYESINIVFSQIYYVHSIVKLVFFIPQLGSSHKIFVIWKKTHTSFILGRKHIFSPSRIGLFVVVVPKNLVPTSSVPSHKIRNNSNHQKAFRGKVET